MAQKTNVRVPDLNGVADALRSKVLKKEATNLEVTMYENVNSFQGYIHRGELQPGDVVYQVVRAGQERPGSYFLSARPVDRIDAESVAYLFPYGNTADEIVTYVVKEPVSVYAGSVAGGTGHQILFPTESRALGHVMPTDVLEKVERSTLPYLYLAQ